MYLGRALSFFGLEFIALAVGMVKGALDEYLELITTRTTHRPPIVLRSHDPDYQRWYGHARAKVDTAEAAMFSAADQWMEACRRQVEDGVPFDVEEDLRIQSITRESVRLCWDALQEYVFRTAGSSAAHDGQRMQRIWRDMSMVWGHLAERHRRLGRARHDDRAPRHRAGGRRAAQGLRPAVGWSYKWRRRRPTASRASRASRCRSTASRRPVREQVLDQLRQAIVEMRLKPEQRLVERELIEQTGVSRTTIREVLRQLAAEGLVTTIPHKGTVVASPSVERAAELYEVRAVLEGMAARQFAERATDVHMRALRRAFEGIESRAKSGRPNSQAMLEAKQPLLRRPVRGRGQRHDPEPRREPAGARHRAARRLAQPARPRAKTVEEVRAIVEALEARDGDAPRPPACTTSTRRRGRSSRRWPPPSRRRLGGRAVALGGQLVEHGLGLAEGLEARRRAAVDHRLQQRLADLLDRAAVVDRAAHVRRGTRACGRARSACQVDQAARAAIEPGARPHVAPAVLGHELLRRPP